MTHDCIPAECPDCSADLAELSPNLARVYDLIARQLAEWDALLVSIPARDPASLRAEGIAHVLRAAAK